MKRKHWVQKPMYIPHGGQTPSYKYTHTVYNGIHVCSPRSITGEMDIISIPSPLKQVHVLCLCQVNSSSLLTVCHTTPHTSSKAEHILAQVSAAERG